MEPQKILISQSNPEIKNKAGGIILTDLKLYYKAIVSKQYDIGRKNDYRPME